MHLRLTLLTGDPAQVDDAIAYIETDARALVESKPGNLGMALKVDRELGVALVQSYWISGDAMRESDRDVRATRDEAAHRATGTVSVENYEIASFAKVAPWQDGGGVRVTRADTDPRGLDQRVAAYEDTALPWLNETPGFCGAVLVVNGRSGHSIEETFWTDAEALAGSRSAAAAIRVDAVKATDSVIRALEEYRLVFNTARAV
jgi:hypothetical protein